LGHHPFTHSLASLFRSRADLTSLKKLAREGVRTVNVLDLSQIEQIVGEAIERALLESSRNGTSPQRAALGAQLELVKMLGGEQRLGEKRQELAQQGAALEKDLGELRSALDEAQSMLRSESAQKKRDAMDELRHRLDRSLADAFARARARVADAAPDAAAALASMQEPLRATMVALLGAAIERTAAPAVPTPAANGVELLERRVRKLTAQLAETQDLLDRTRRQKEDDAQGVPSIYKEVQGLRGTEDQVDTRRALMREIYEHNLELRRTLGARPPDVVGR
jgi:hypothetical protein